jgi:flagellar biosynthetic protein FlhB
MAEGAEADDKTEEPTPKRIEDARKRGDVIHSTEVGSAFTLLALTLIVAFLAGPIVRDLGLILRTVLANVGDYTVEGPALAHLFGAILLRVLGAIGLVALALASAGLASRFIQDRPGWSPSRISPKLERINPFEGAKRVFGPQAVGNFAKTALKFLIVGSAVAWALWPRDGTLAMMPMLDVAALMPFVLDRAIALLIACTVAAALVAAVDYVFVRRAYRKRLRMTRRELKDEFRQSEGDPHIRARLRQLRQERSRTRMMAAVPEATVVITNPTHYAVALKYDREVSPAPVCVAKGVNEVALRIREMAAEHDVPVIENPPLARALYATAEIDEVIPREHFEAVAKVIGYVLQLARRRRR